MAKQTKPFIVEIKQSRKLKSSAPKPSIWGKLDLSLVPHAGLVDNGILLLKEGSLMAGAIVYRRAAADEATREHRGRTPDRGDQP